MGETSVSTDTKRKINYMLLGVVVVVIQAVGALWYSPFLFGKIWARNLGVSPEQVPAMIGTSPYLLSILGSILLCMVLNRMMVLTKTKTLIGGIKLAVLLWLGLVFTTLSTHYAFMGVTRMIFIDAGKDLLAMIIAGGILASGQE